MAGYKNNIQKSIVFLYNSNEQSENEIQCNPLHILLLFLFSFFLFFLIFFFQKSSSWCYISYGNITQNNQNILEKEEQIWKIHISWLQNLLKKPTEIKV